MPFFLQKGRARQDSKFSAARARRRAQVLGIQCCVICSLCQGLSLASPAGGEVLFSATTLHSEQPVLLSLLPEPGGLKVLVHADDAMAGSLLLDEAKEALKLR